MSFEISLFPSYDIKINVIKPGKSEDYHPQQQRKETNMENEYLQIYQSFH